jgi:hypothetical protein
MGVEAPVLQSDDELSNESGILFAREIADVPAGNADWPVVAVKKVIRI